SCCLPDEQVVRPEGVAQPVQWSNEDHAQRFEARRWQRSDAGNGRQGDVEAYVSISEPQQPRPSEPPARHDASERICGRMTHYVIEATTVVDADRAFLGLWTGAIGDWKSCGALIVGSLRSNGSGKTATITYIEGPPPWQSGTGRTAPGDLLEWKRIDRDAAVVNRGELYFETDSRCPSSLYLMRRKRTAMTIAPMQSWSSAVTSRAPLALRSL